jgi:molecular chaperone DnaK
MAQDNKTIGRFQLTGIPPAPRGVPQVEVTFDIDANGILHVSALDKATGKEQKIRIEASSGLSEGEIDRMVEEAEEHADEDRQRREQVDARNQLDSLVYQTEKNLEDWKEAIDDSAKQDIEAAIEEGKKALKEGEHSDIQAAGERLNQAVQAAAQQMYAKAGA